MAAMTVRLQAVDEPSAWQFGPVGESEYVCGAPELTITTAFAVFGEIYFGVRPRARMPFAGIVKVNNAVAVLAACAGMTDAPWDPPPAHPHSMAAAPDAARPYRT